MASERCHDIDCAPPFGDKEDCEFHCGGICTAATLHDKLDRILNQTDKMPPGTSPK